MMFPENPGRKFNSTVSLLALVGGNSKKVLEATKVVVAVRPAGLLTNHRTAAPPVVKVVENPPAGIGHNGSGSAPTGVTLVIGPSCGPI